MLAEDLTSDTGSSATKHCNRYFDEIDDTIGTSVDLDVHASSAELGLFERQGFLVRPGLLSAAGIERFGAALAEVAANEGVANYEAGVFAQDKVFGGWGPRWLMHRHETFLQLAYWEPVLSVVRAMLGPRVRVRHCQSRVTWPSAQAVSGETNNDSSWHHHMRHVPKPLPPFWSYPHRVDCLIYLDELNAQTGGLYVVPGSHLLQHQPLNHTTMMRITDGISGANIVEDSGSVGGGAVSNSIQPQLITGTAPGTVVLMHRQLWHRAAPNLRLNTKDSSAACGGGGGGGGGAAAAAAAAAAATATNTSGGMRRMILVQFAPLEGRRSPMGRHTKPPPPNPVSRLVAEAARTGDTETLELLGKSGFQ